MKTFYYFQFMVDIGVGLIIAGCSVGVGFPLWFPLCAFGLYLIVNYAKQTYDFVDILKESSEK
jgi:hypothetical protein